MLSVYKVGYLLHPDMTVCSQEEIPFVRSLQSTPWAWSNALWASTCIASSDTVAPAC